MCLNPSLNPAISSDAGKLIVNVVKLGLTFTFTCLSKGKTPDGLSSLVLNGLFHVVGYSPPPEAEDEILQTVKNIENQNAAMTKRLEYMSAEHKMDFRLNSMDDSYVELKSMHTLLQQKMKIDAEDAIEYILTFRDNVEKCMEQAHNHLVNQSNNLTHEGKRLLAVQAIQSHLWSKLADTYNFEQYGISSYLEEARYFVKRMCKIQYLGTSLLVMLVDLWKQKEYEDESPFEGLEKIQKYRAALDETFIQRIKKYEQALLGLDGDRIDHWPSSKFLLRQAQLKSNGYFPELFRLQIGDNDLYYDYDTVKSEQGAFRDGDLRSAWVFHLDDTETYVLSASGSRFRIYRQDVRKLRGEGITSAFTQPLYQRARFEKTGRFKLIPQRGGTDTTFSIRAVDFANSVGEVVEMRISPTAQHEPAADLLRPDDRHSKVERMYQSLRSSYGSTLDDGSETHGFIIHVYIVSPSPKSVMVLNHLYGGGVFEATAASHLLITHRNDQNHMQVWRRSFTDVPYLVLKFRAYWVEDGDISDQRLTDAFRRSPGRGEPCLVGKGIQETADIFVRIDHDDRLFWWENSTISAEVLAPTDAKEGEFDQWDQDAWVVKANDEETRCFNPGNMAVRLKVEKGALARAHVKLATTRIY